MDVLKGTGVIILLTAATEELIRRVKQADRPRVNVGTTLQEDIRLMWQTSKDKYYKAANIVYKTDRKNIEEEIQELKQVVLDNFKRRDSNFGY
jgi:shikimate kinase